jgi:cell division GTPase FtsZ
MKNFKTILSVLIISVLLSGCGVQHAFVLNSNNNVTNVELSKKNFKVVEKVTGSSTARYIFGIGGINEKALIENAKSEMLLNANLEGAARAIVNITIEEDMTFYFVYFKRTVTVSGHIVEFTE